MRPRVVLAPLMLAALVPRSATTQTSLTDEPVFRVNVRVEVVDVQVISKKTRQVISSLKREDFEVYEDNVRQEISAFSQDELPMSIVFLFDLTDSVRPVLQSLAEGAREVLQHLRPQDEVAVMVYAAAAELVQEPTTDRALAAAAIEKASRMKSDEAAFFNEGIFQASLQLGHSKDPASRRIVIWLTDDVPNIPSEETRSSVGRSVPEGKLHSEKDALMQVLKTGTVVCTLLKKSDISEREDSNRTPAKIAGSMLYPPGEVYKYARATGGQVVEASAKKMKARITQLIDDLRMRYSLSYHPATERPKGKFCAIKIKLAPDVRKSQGGLLIEAKQGYYR